MRQLNPVALREIRKLVGITQAELAERAGIHQGTMTNIELGKHGVSAQVIRKLADALGSPVDAITYVVPDPEPEAVA
jgi:transcriptional regulator with XRE-family HTH domain